MNRRKFLSTLGASAVGIALVQVPLASSAEASKFLELGDCANRRFEKRLLYFREGARLRNCTFVNCVTFFGGNVTIDAECSFLVDCQAPIYYGRLPPVAFGEGCKCQGDIFICGVVSELAACAS